MICSSSCKSRKTVHTIDKIAFEAPRWWHHAPNKDHWHTECPYGICPGYKQWIDLNHSGHVQKHGCRHSTNNPRNPESRKVSTIREHSSRPAFDYVSFNVARDGKRATLLPHLDLPYDLQRYFQNACLCAQTNVHVR